MINIINNLNIFDIKSDILVNPVNRKLISGAGLAKLFKVKFPEHDEVWRKMNKNKLMNYGEIQMVNLNNNSPIIIYFATKNDPYDPISDKQLILNGLDNLYNNNIIFNNEYNINENTVINIPALGCGLGNLRFEWLEEKIFEIFKNINYTINLFKPL